MNFEPEERKRGFIGEVNVLEEILENGGSF